jgi:hypothetical protein
MMHRQSVDVELQLFADLRARTIFFLFRPFSAEQPPWLQFLSDRLKTYLILLALKVRSHQPPSIFLLVAE